MDCFDYIQTVLSGYVPDDLHSVQFTMVSNQASEEVATGLPPDPTFGAVCSYAWGLLAVNNDLTEISGIIDQYFSDRLVSRVSGPAGVFDPNQTDQMGVNIKIDSTSQKVALTFTLMSRGNTTYTLSDLQCTAGVMTGTGPNLGNRPFNALYIISLGIFIETE